MANGVIERAKGKSFPILTSV